MFFSFADEVGFRLLLKALWVPVTNSVPGVQPGGVSKRWRAQPERARQTRKRVYNKEGA